MSPPEQEANPYVVAAFAWAICFAVMLSLTLGNVSQLSLLNDDYVRLVQVYDFLDGQGWRDTTQYRLAPPEGLAMHWSRLPDLPLALVIGITEGLFGRDGATKIALVAVSGVYLLLLFLISVRLALALNQRKPEDASDGSQEGRRRLGNLTVLYVLFGLDTIVQFVPGRIDHHNLQIILALGVLLCTTLSLNEGDSERRRDRMALLAGLLAALSLAIGLEALPILIAAQASYGLLWALGSNDALRSSALRAGRLAALACAGTAAAVTVLLAPAGSLFATHCDSLSGVYLALLGLVAGFWIVLTPLQALLTTLTARLAAGAVMAGTTAAFFAVLAPQCLAGPYAEVDPLLRELWLNNVFEAKGIADLIARPDRLAASYAYPLIAFVSLAALYRLGALTAPARWVPLAVFLTIAFLVSLSQLRFGSFAQAFAIFPVAMLALNLMVRAPKLSTPVVRLAPTVAILALLNPLAVILPARGLTEVPEQPGLDRTEAPTCGLPGDLAALADAPRARILGFTDIGPELLFFTPHEVLAAPYHRNTQGLLTAIHFFTAGDDAMAQGLAAQAGADYVIFCRDLPESTLYRVQSERGLMARLLQGEVPDWLVPEPTLGGAQLQVFRVADEALGEAPSAPSQAPAPSPAAKSQPAILERVIE